MFTETYQLVSCKQKKMLNLLMENSNLSSKLLKIMKRNLQFSRMKSRNLKSTLMLLPSKTRSLLVSLKSLKDNPKRLERDSKGKLKHRTSKTIPLTLPQTYRRPIPSQVVKPSRLPTRLSPTLRQLLVDRLSLITDKPSLGDRQWQVVEAHLFKDNQLPAVEPKDSLKIMWYKAVQEVWDKDKRFRVEELGMLEESTPLRLETTVLDLVCNIPHLLRFPL